MKKIFLRLMLLVTIAMVFVGAGTLATPAAGEAVVIVVNKSNTTGDLSVDEVRKLFLGEKRAWDGSKKVGVIMLAAGTPARETVLRSVFKMNESEYNRYMLQAVFTGKVATAPTDVASAAMMKKLVAANPGAIGYVHKSEADDTVKVVCELH
jgi:ABC-type phosphate transport system substrate-binding protein